MHHTLSTAGELWGALGPGSRSESVFERELERLMRLSLREILLLSLPMLTAGELLGALGPGRRSESVFEPEPEGLMKLTSSREILLFSLPMLTVSGFRDSVLWSNNLVPKGFKKGRGETRVQRL